MQGLAVLAVAAASANVHEHLVKQLTKDLQQEPLMWPRLRMLSLLNRLGIAYPDSRRLRDEMGIAQDLRAYASTFVICLPLRTWCHAQLCAYRPSSEALKS